MKRLLKIPVMVGLIISVFVFSIYCCCFTHLAQAKEKIPACHQTHQKQSHKAHDCDCHKNTLANAVETISDVYLPNIISVAFNSVVAVLSPVTLALRPVFPESPPGFYSSVPLYIQNSVLRI